MEDASDAATALPYWLSLQWPRDPACQQDSDGHWYLQFGIREGAMSGWPQLLERHVAGTFDPYFKLWRIRPVNATSQAALQEFLELNQFGTMDPGQLDAMRALTEGDGGTYRVIPNGYSVRGENLGVLHGLLEDATEVMGSNAHLEWYADGVQILCRDQRIQCLVRQLLVAAGLCLKSPVFPGESPDQPTPLPEEGQDQSLIGG